MESRVAAVAGVVSEVPENIAPFDAGGVLTGGRVAHGGEVVVHVGLTRDAIVAVFEGPGVLNTISIVRVVLVRGAYISHGDI